MTLLFDKLFGKPIATAHEETEQVGVVSGIAILGLDALSSAAYGPEAALTILLPLGSLGLSYIGPITAIIIAILILLYFSYRQTLTAYPCGGGSYTVASENLGENLGLLAGVALLIDYVLNVAVGISAGVGALVSAVPSLQPHILSLCLLILALLTIINLRGTRESGLAFLVPTYLFVISLTVIILIGLWKSFITGGHPIAVIPPQPLLQVTEGATLWILIRAFASGCTAMTGVEAVSNGIPIFAAPQVERAKQTLTAIVSILGILLAGIAYLSFAYHIGATDPSSVEYQSILSQLIGAVIGRGIFYYLTIGSVLCVLSLSANTSFADFPRLCSLLSKDNYLPHGFGSRGRRLVYTMGITILALLSAGILIIFDGITDRLIPLFAIGAFLAFTLSQAGMVVHWRKIPGSFPSLVLNILGTIATSIALVVVLVAKFSEGAWIVILTIPLSLYALKRIKVHYRRVVKQIAYEAPLDLSEVPSPIVVIPIKGWSRISARAIKFGMQISPNVVAVHVNDAPGREGEVLRQWNKYVVEPLDTVERKIPTFVSIPSPYRKLFAPLLTFIDTLKKENPNQDIVVIVPELIEPRWYHYFLHNQQALALKAALLLQGDRRVIVITVPWHLRK